MGLGTRLITVWPMMTEKDKDHEAGQSSSPNAKKLVEIERKDRGTITKILRESYTELLSLGRGSLGLRQMCHDPDRLIGRELSRPSDDKFLRIVERAGRFFQL